MSGKELSSTEASALANLAPPEPGPPLSGAEVDELVRELSSSAEAIELVDLSSRLHELRWAGRMLGRLEEPELDWRHPFRELGPSRAIGGERRWSLAWDHRPKGQPLSGSCEPKATRERRWRAGRGRTRAMAL